MRALGEADDERMAAAAAPPRRSRLPTLPLDVRQHIERFIPLATTAAALLEIWPPQPGDEDARIDLHVAKQGLVSQCIDLDVPVRTVLAAVQASAATTEHDRLRAAQAVAAWEIEEDYDVMPAPSVMYRIDRARTDLCELAEFGPRGRLRRADHWDRVLHVLAQAGALAPAPPATDGLLAVLAHQGGRDHSRYDKVRRTLSAAVRGGRRAHTDRDAVLQAWADVYKTPVYVIQRFRNGEPGVARLFPRHSGLAPPLDDDTERRACMAYATWLLADANEPVRGLNLEPPVWHRWDQAEAGLHVSRLETVVADLRAALLSDDAVPPHAASPSAAATVSSSTTGATHSHSPHGRRQP
jgi:hypothetical protein